MQKDSVFIEGQIETITLPMLTFIAGQIETIRVPMLIITSKISEVLVGPFFLYLKANNKIKLFLAAMSGSPELKKTHGIFQTWRVPLT